MNLHRADELSDSGIYQLDDLHRMFSTTTGKVTDMFTFSDQESPDMEYARTVLVAEVFRVLKHKQARHATEESDERIKNEIQSRFNGTDTFEGALAELRNLITELLITRRMYSLFPAAGVSQRVAGWWKDDLGELLPPAASTSSAGAEEAAG
jgi:hypothetical protein